MLRLFKPIFVVIAIFSIAACNLLSQAADTCVSEQALYQASDSRKIDRVLFQQGLTCANPERVQVALIAIGRIGGQEAAKQISPLLNAKSAEVRAAAAFALGISGDKTWVKRLQLALQNETNPQVLRELTLAIGNLASEDSWSILSKVITHSQEIEAVRGALQGLGLISVFNRQSIGDKTPLQQGKLLDYLAQTETELEASFLLARSNFLKSSDIPRLLSIYPKLGDDAKAQLIRASGKLTSPELTKLYLKESKSKHIGIRSNSIAALGRNLNHNPEAFAQLQQLTYLDDVVTQIAAISQLKNYMYPLRVKSHLISESSWVRSHALLQFIERNHELETMQGTAKKWLDSKEPNLERAAIAYFVKQNEQAQLEALSQHKSEIVANGAKAALKRSDNSPTSPLATPELLAELPEALILHTSKGPIKIELFADTPYTSANFVRLAQEGFYDNSYFHRVIPNFVAQGGSKNGDGTGTVDFSIREELSMRSHRRGTIGMATAGKDTGGGQFFINLAPNLHLDSNYTIFGQVLEGMDVAESLEQNDQIISVELKE